MRIPRLVKQFVIRAGAMFTVKMIGLVGRVILTRIVGAEGIGLYQIAYSFFGFILMLTSGFPTTLAIATARSPFESWGFYKKISPALVLCCGLLSLSIFKNSTGIARLLSNPELEYAIRSIALSLFAVPLLGLLRGYLQGQKQIGIIALSEIVEQSFRFVFMLLFVAGFLSLGVERAIGYGLYGTFMGAFISFVMLTVFIAINRTGDSNDMHMKPVLTMSWFLKSSLAISSTRIFIPLSEFVDAFLVPNRLAAAGYNTSEATAIYGVIYGMGVLVVYAPTLFTGAMNHILTGHIAAEWLKGNLKKFTEICNTALSACWLWGVVSGLYLFMYADELSYYIFNTDSASPVIKFLAPIPLIVGFREISTNILWVQDIRDRPFFGLLSGIVCSIIVQYFLVAIPGFGYEGAAIAILVLELSASFWNMKALYSKGFILRGITRPLLYDLIFGIFILFVSVAWFRHSENIMNLWRFIYITMLYFIVSGIYVYFRCIRKLLKQPSL